MRKLKFTSVLLLFLALGLNLKAQDNDYAAGQWYFGPHLSFNSGFRTGNNDFGGYVMGINAGAYFGYSFTDLLGFNAGVLYGNDGFVFSKSEYIKVPALLMFQFSSKHLGLGLQYNHSITKLDEADFVDYNESYLSAIIEFGYFPQIPYYAGRDIIYLPSKFRALIRVGYALTPKTYTILGELPYGEGAVRKPNTDQEFNPIFFEFGIQYNIGQHFNNKKATRKKTRRR